MPLKQSSSILEKKMTTENKPITVKQYLEIFKFSTVENLKHIRNVLRLSSLHGEDLHNRYEAVKIALGEK
jgi:hypothetical protein